MSPNYNQITKHLANNGDINKWTGHSSIKNQFDRLLLTLKYIKLSVMTEVLPSIPIFEGT